MVIDEFAFVDENMVTNGIFPILPVRSTALLAVTTFGKSPKNFATELLRKGTFPTLTVSLLCQACYDKGCTDVCKHRLYLLPSWINQSQRQLIKDALGPARLLEYAKEMLGMIIEENNNCFPEVFIKAVFESSRVVIRKPVDFLFVAIDPSGGSQKVSSTTSDFAVCCHINPFTIVGLDAFPICNGFEINDRLKSLINKILSHSMFSKTKIVLTIEGNLGPTAGYIAKFMSDQFPGRVITLSTFTGGEKVGMLQTNKTKVDSYILLRHRLYEWKVNLAEKVATTDISEEVILNKLQEQLLAYKMTIGANNVMKFSGKGDNFTAKDDLAMAVQIGIFGSHYFYADDRYTKYLM